MNARARVPFTFLELAGVACISGVAVVNLLDANSASPLGAILVLVTVVGSVAWLVQMHRSRPEVFAQRMPSELLWTVGLVGLPAGSLWFSGPGWASKVSGALLVIGVFCVVLNERIRELPELPPDYEPKAGGRHFGPTDAQGLEWRRKFGRAILIGAGTISAVLLALGLTIGLVGLAMTIPGALVWEIWWSVAKRRRLGYYALLDE